MPEEATGELYTDITAKTDEFERGLNLVDTRLDALEDTQITVQAETKATEAGISALSMEGMGFGGILTWLISKIYESSGALQALTDTTFGYMGAALDVFIIQSLVPALQDAGTWLSEQKVALDKILAVLPGYKTSTDEATTATDDQTTAVWELTEEQKLMQQAMEDGTIAVYGMGNALLEVDGTLYYFDASLQEMTAITGDLDQSMLDLMSDTDMADTMLAGFAERSGIKVEDLMLAITKGADAVRDLYEGMDYGASEHYLNNVATAAERALDFVGEFLIQIGIDPRTGESIDWGELKTEYRRNRMGGTSGPISEQLLVDYMLSGQ